MKLGRDNLLPGSDDECVLGPWDLGVPSLELHLACLQHGLDGGAAPGMMGAYFKLKSPFPGGMDGGRLARSPRRGGERGCHCQGFFNPMLVVLLDRGKPGLCFVFASPTASPPAFLFFFSL